MWKLWPANRRANSDKRTAFKRYQAGVEQFGAERIERAAKRYLSLPETRKEGYQFCCLVEVFMNGKLEAAVEAADAWTSGERETPKPPPGYKFGGYDANGKPYYNRDHSKARYS